MLLEATLGFSGMNAERAFEGVAHLHVVLLVDPSDRIHQLLRVNPGPDGPDDWFGMLIADNRTFFLDLHEFGVALEGPVRGVLPAILARPFRIEGILGRDALDHFLQDGILLFRIDNLNLGEYL